MKSKKEIEKEIYGFNEAITLPPASIKVQLIELAYRLEQQSGGNADLTPFKEVIAKIQKQIEHTIINPILEDEEFNWSRVK